MSQKPAARSIEDPLSAARAVFERRLALLAFLTEVGMARARAVAAAPGASLFGGCGAWPRIARAVRLTIALARRTYAAFEAWRLAPHPLPEMDDADEASAAAAEDRPEAGDDENLIDYENLTDYEDLNEFRWLTSEQNEFARILEKPFEEIVARICKDLGVKFDREAWACGAKPEAVFDAGEGEQAVSEVGLQRPHIGSSGKLNAEDAEARRARGEEKFRLEPSGGP